MRRLIRKLWNQFTQHSLQTPNQRRAVTPWRVRPMLERLEDRLTPSTLPGVVTGAVQLGSGVAFSGVSVTLTGVTNSGKQVNVSVLTQSDGSYAFSQVQAGRYSLSTNAGVAFLNGQTSFNFNVDGAGQFSTNNFGVVIPGLAPQFVSLASFLSDSTTFQLPQGGFGFAEAFSLDSFTPLLAQTLSLATQSSGVPLDLSTNFQADTIVQFQTPQGNIDVELFDADAPQTVANFLAYIEAGDFQDALFTRESSLTQNADGTFALTPEQVLQGGGFNVAPAAINGNLISGSAVVTGLSSTAKLTAGTPVTGSGIPANTAIKTVDSANQITLTKAATASGTKALSFLYATMPAFPSINLETTGHSNAVGTLAMAEGTVGGQTIITNQFFFNLTDNSSTLGPPQNFPVFGQVVPSSATLSNYANTFTPLNEVGANGAFSALPTTGYTPPSGDKVLTGATVNNLATITNIQVIQPSAGPLTYSNLTSSNSQVVKVQLQTNTSSSAKPLDQLLLTPVGKGTATVSVQVTDKAGDTVIKTFNVTVN